MKCIVTAAQVIKIAQKTNAKKILDLCTGSGAIAVSLAKYLPQSEITAIDISNDALKIAKKNADSNNVENRFIDSIGDKIGNNNWNIEEIAGSGVIATQDNSYPHRIYCDTKQRCFLHPHNRFQQVFWEFHRQGRQKAQ